ncbi:Alg9-like mannosyltransferase family-domain-containing protein [Aspergillus avenaceus]|uniref:Mannosyltransferase n=1 Tax=Aspergillus avenaceus TaxID=36643 RepID=A0A5N6TQ96_ASPAV|nr:Alg9-like mannosyltransferase family-domain-containing protein [Aspergillus avenaceus]
MVDRQFLARVILGCFNAASLLSFATGLRRAFGKSTAIWYMLYQASQFHILYYASRTLSNMFAFGITTLALRCVLPEYPQALGSAVDRKRCRLSLCLLTIAGIIFRSELALLLATTTIVLFLTGRIGILRDIVPAGVLGLLLGLSTTVLIDSFFWQQFPLWPEFAAFVFNVIHGQSSAWGTHPWHFYFTNAIPRLLLNPLAYLIALPCALLQPSTRSAAAYLLIPSITFIFIYSFNPHKEWRFIVYTIPPLTAACALGASYIWTHRTKTVIHRLLSLAMVLSTLVSFFISTFVLLPASSANYPGAHALRVLHNHAHSTHPTISVHLCNLACQTGVTRFLEMPVRPAGSAPADSTLPEKLATSWRYDKTEDATLKSTQSFWAQFDYVLVEPDEEAKLRSMSDLMQWQDIDVVNGFAGLSIVRPSEAAGTVEEQVLQRFAGEETARFWSLGREFARNSFTRGWWVELKMEPKIKILKRITA